MLKSLSLVACLSLLASPVLAAEEVGKAPEDSAKVVCKKVMATGWRLARETRVCLTKAEWDAEANASREQTKRNANDRLGG